jgi:hypothetical protein
MFTRTFRAWGTQIIGKWGVEKWFLVPEGLYRELVALRMGSTFVFAVYPKQVRRYYEQSCRHGPAKNVVGEFAPENLANWFYKKLKAWSKSLPKGHASTHIFRKTSLQYARSGEDINRQVAQDARVSETVLMTNYVKETDEQLRAKSNRTYERILASLSPEVAHRYGHVEPKADQLEQQIQVAVAAKDWTLAARLTARLRPVKHQKRDRGLGNDEKAPGQTGSFFVNLVNRLQPGESRFRCLVASPLPI